LLQLIIALILLDVNISYFPLPFDPLFFPIFGVGDFVIENEDIFYEKTDHELSKELIVRLVELETYGTNSKTMEIFNPLRYSISSL
jgi:hypothetical protein